MTTRHPAFVALLCSTLLVTGVQSQAGFTPLFNGRDLTGWKVPAGDHGHWRVLDGVIDYDAESQAAGDKALWSEKSFGDFVLRADWRIKATPYVNPNVYLIKPDGSHKKDADGKEIKLAVPDSDSGIYLRGASKAQVNIWAWPAGSGEVYGYRTDAAMPAAVRAGVTPTRNADRDIGQWNTFEICPAWRRAGRSPCSTTAPRRTACGRARRASSSSAIFRSRSCRGRTLLPGVDGFPRGRIGRQLAQLQAVAVRIGDGDRASNVWDRSGRPRSRAIAARVAPKYRVPRPHRAG